MQIELHNFEPFYQQVWTESFKESRRSVPGIGYDSAINVHICCNSVPGHVGSYVRGISAVYENQALRRGVHMKILLKMEFLFLPEFES